MTSELNPLLRLQVLNVLLIEGFAKRVAVRRLAPLCMRIGVALATTLGRDEHVARDEGPAGGGSIAGRKRVWPKFEIVGPGNLAGVGIVRSRRLQVGSNWPAVDQ